MIPKYTPFELSTMAFIVLNEKQNSATDLGDPSRADRLVSRVSEETGLPEAEVWKRITFLATGVQV